MPDVAVPTDGSSHEVAHTELAPNVPQRHPGELVSGCRPDAQDVPTGRACELGRYVVREGAGIALATVLTDPLEPQDRDTAIRSIHRDDNNRFNPEGEGWVVRTWVELTDNPDSYMLLMDTGPDGLPDPATETRLDLHRGARFVLDTQRLWHVAVHKGAAPRYALICSFESGPALDAWIESQHP